ncbi:uncharacterized protein LOC120218053 [Hibiscus syriacus]|uniref:uncharacterized protein LOC120218053 n=1 Tax=Hibiscus syriacus TaxID=106335 RepID=UPI001921CD2E|nr:uncharacterized protein LOC120218053 [Hibiscus syriacus]
MQRCFWTNKPIRSTPTLFYHFVVLGFWKPISSLSLIGCSAATKTAVASQEPGINSWKLVFTFTWLVTNFSFHFPRTKLSHLTHRHNQRKVLGRSSWRSRSRNFMVNLGRCSKVMYSHLMNENQKIFSRKRMLGLFIFL